MKKNILKILFIAWIILWIAFLARELFVKANLKDYRALLSRSAEGKRSYVTGDELYGFIEFCRKAVPERASYSLIGIEDGAVEKRRAAYYLYPMTESRDADFLFIYKISNFTRAGYDPFMKLDDSRYILRKRNGK